MLQPGADHMIARLDESANRQVQAIGRVMAENRPLRAVTIKKTRQLRPCLLDKVPGPDRSVESRTAGIDSVVTVKVDHEIVDRFGFWPGCGGVIEVNQRPVVH